MYSGQLVFSQVMDHLPLHTFRRCVARYRGERYVKQFRCLDQYLAMAFAQLTYRESLRDIEACLRAQQTKLYHMGLRCTQVARNTLAKANERRDWRIYADFAQSLIRIARPLYADEDLGLELDNTVYALDASTIDLCLSVFPWALFRSTKSAVKLHTLLDLRGNIPTFIHISKGKLHDVNVLDILLPEPGAFYIMDRGYVDFGRLFSLHTAGAFFVIRAKSNTRYRRRYSAGGQIRRCALRPDHRADRGGYGTHLSAAAAPGELPRRPDRQDLPLPDQQLRHHPQTLADLYRYRWQVELFFKWIKQHLRIKSFFGTSENAVKSQIWIAISVYVLVAIIKKRLDIRADLYTILQILSLTLFEKTSLFQLVENTARTTEAGDMPNQLSLFDNLAGQ